MTTNSFKHFILDDPDLKISVNERAIVVFEVMNWKRSTVDKWVAYVRSRSGKLQPPVRVIYDLRRAGPPSQYFLDIEYTVLIDLELPEDMRSVYLFAPGPNTHYGNSFIQRAPSGIGHLKALTDWDEAVAWLLAPEIDT